MKLFVVLFVFLLGTSAFAAGGHPATGDFVKFRVEAQYPTSFGINFWSHRFIARGQNWWTIEGITYDSQGKEGRTFVETFRGDRIVTSREIAKLLKTCESKPNRKLVSVTVPVGTFQACQITENDMVDNLKVVRNWWYGNVPDGMIKDSHEFSNGTYVKHELIELVMTGGTP